MVQYLSPKEHNFISLVNDYDDFDSKRVYGNSLDEKFVAFDSSEALLLDDDEDPQSVPDHAEVFMPLPF